MPAGGVLAGYRAPSLVLLIGWRGALAALGVLNFIFGFIFSLLWREPAAENVAGQPTANHDGRSHRRPLNVWGFLPMSFGTAIYLIGQMSLITYLPLYLKDADGVFTLLGEPGSGLAQAGRDGRPGRLGRCQRPNLRRPA